MSKIMRRINLGSIITRRKTLVNRSVSNCPSWMVDQVNMNDKSKALEFLVPNSKSKGAVK